MSRGGKWVVLKMHQCSSQSGKNHITIKNFMVRAANSTNLLVPCISYIFTAAS